MAEIACPEVKMEKPLARPTVFIIITYNKANEIDLPPPAAAPDNPRKPKTKTPPGTHKWKAPPTPHNAIPPFILLVRL